MARRRSYRGLVRFPGLSGLSIPKTVNLTDVVVGLAAGFAGSGALKFATGKLTAGGTALPSFLTSGSPLVGGAATGAVLYFAQKKKNASRAAGQAVGAILGGLAVWGWGMLQSSGLPGFSDLRTLPGGYGGPIFDNPGHALAGFNGPIFDNPGRNLGQLARLQGMGDEQEDGIFPAP